jgi:hypothetical protein
VHGRILLELALVRVAALEDLEAVSDIIRQVAQAETDAAPAAPRRIAAAPARVTPPRTTPPRAAASDAAPPPAVPPTAPAEESPPVKATATGKKKTSAELTPDGGSGAAAGKMTETTAGGSAEALAPLDPQQAQEIWRAALADLNDVTADYANYAEAVASSGPNRLVVSFRQVYNSSKSFCERPERRQQLEDSLSRKAQRPIRLEFELLRDDSAHAVPPAPAVSQQRQRQQVTRHPFVERALAVFEGEIINVNLGKEPGSHRGHS